MTQLDRRTLLLGSAAGALTLGRGLGAAGRGDEDESLLVVVELRGGNDGLNTIVPFEDDHYYRARPNLALAKKDVLRLDDLNGMHPALQRTAQRFGRDGVAVVQGVGHRVPDLSHFRSQDIWGAGSTDPAGLPETGWLGRASDRDPRAPANPVARLSVGAFGLPYALRGERTACAVPSLERYARRTAPNGTKADERRARQRALEALNQPAGEMRGMDPAALTHATRAAETARLSLADLARVRAFEPVATWPDTQLATDLRLVAGALAAGLPTRIAYVVLDGFDTHARQAGKHAELLAELDGAVDAFLNEMEARGRLDRTLVVTVSEFGRRVAENGVGKTAGTDHGAASVALLMGGRVRGGVHGDPPHLDRLDPDGNQPHTTHFLELYQTVVKSWLGVKDERVLGGGFEPLGVLS